ADGQLPQDTVGQGDLQAAQGDGGALVCGCQTAARAPLCAVPRPHEGNVAMPAGSRQPEHEEDRPGTHPETTHGRGVSPRAPSSSSLRQRPQRRLPAPTKNPPKKSAGLSAV